MSPAADDRRSINALLMALRAAKALSCLVLAVALVPTLQAQTPEPWQTDFLTALEHLHQDASPVYFRRYEDYAERLLLRDPVALKALVEQRVALRPYTGSMIEPGAALLGGAANSLDRARLLADLLARSGRESRIRAAAIKAHTTELRPTPASAQPVSPDLHRALEWEVQRLAPGVWQRICPGVAGCSDWRSIVKDTPQTQTTAYWVQYREAGAWHDLIMADNRVSDGLMATAQTVTETLLESLRWKVGITVMNQYEGAPKSETVLHFEAPAGELSHRPISIDNLPNHEGEGFIPTLSLGERPPVHGKLFALHSGSGSQRISHQLVEIVVAGPTQVRRYRRLLAEPGEGAEKLEMVTRGRLTLSTSSLWPERARELAQLNLERSANLLYADDEHKDSRPLNLTSFKSLLLLDLSRQLAGRVGNWGPKVQAYQGRPALVMERDYPTTVSGQIHLGNSFDILDTGNAFSCTACDNALPLKAAIEQGVLDGVLESWIAGDENSLTSHGSIQELLTRGIPLQRAAPAAALWEDSSTPAPTVYRIGTVDGMVTGWRLQSGPAVIPILENGLGGVTSKVATAATSSLITSIITNATTKCGATDISASIILSLAGAPMTTPLLSGIVGHNCRVAEAYNKAASVLNCLEFMGNDCSATDKASELENMLKGLGPALGTDLAIAMAVDILVGAAVDHVIAPEIRLILKRWRQRTPRAHMPPPGGSAMPPRGTKTPGSGDSALPPTGKGKSLEPEEFGPGDLTPAAPKAVPSSNTDSMVDKLLPKDLHPPAPKPAPDVYTPYPNRRLLPKQNLPAESVQAMQEGLIPVRKGETWNGAMQYGRVTDGPFNLDKAGSKSHKQMGIDRTSARTGFVVGRDPITGEIMALGSGRQGRALTRDEKSTLVRMVEKWIAKNGS